MYGNDVQFTIHGRDKNNDMHLVGSVYVVFPYAIRQSYGIFKPSYSYLIMPCVRFRFLLSTSDTRPLVSINGSRSLRDRLFCSIKNLIASIVSDAGIA